MKTTQEILEIRAKELSLNFQENTDVKLPDSVVIFELQKEKYAVNSNYIKEVINLKEITQIPGTPNFIMGLINYRGNILSVVNLIKLFKIKESGLTEMNKIIIFECKNMIYGIIADKIIGRNKIDFTKLNTPPLTLSHAGAFYIKGIGNEGLIVLEESKLAHSQELIINQ